LIVGVWRCWVIGGGYFRWGWESGWRSSAAADAVRRDGRRNSAQQHREARKGQPDPGGGGSREESKIERAQRTSLRASQRQRKVSMLTEYFIVNYAAHTIPLLEHRYENVNLI